MKLFGLLLAIVSLLLLATGATTTWLLHRSEPGAEQSTATPAVRVQAQASKRPPADPSAELLLEAPSKLPAGFYDGLEPTLTPRETSFKAQALYFRTRIYGAPSSKSTVRGIARRGVVLSVLARAKGSGCKGSWYQVEGGGYICTTRGFLVRSKLPKLDLHYSLPNLRAAVPYRYGKVTSSEALRYYRLPTVEEEQQAKQAKDDEQMPDVVERKMEGVFLLAFHGPLVDAERAFFTTVRGRVVRQDVIEPRPGSKLHGELLKGKKLPLAFVYGEDRPLYRLQSGKMVEVGTAQKHARFRPGGKLRHGDKLYLRAPNQTLMLREHLRVVRKIKRPEGIPAGSRWIHVALEQQTLVAYQGDRPVLATLISGGKEGYEAPTGLFRISKKYNTTTMDGPDPIDGWYEVEEVPWTMYYLDSYALHGAYWHNDFGKPRSHGCTNIAPHDARWLYYWSSPKVPVNWHGRHSTGTHVYFSKGG